MGNKTDNDCEVFSSLNIQELVKAFGAGLFEESMEEDRIGRRQTDVISSFRRFVNMVSPRPPPIEVRISTF